MQEREMYLFLCSIYRISQEEIDILTNGLKRVVKMF